MFKHDALRPFFDGIASGYETHRPALCEAIVRTRGPILELGVGDGSTPALHAAALASDRRLYSFDHDAGFVARFASLRCEGHLVASLSSWDDCPIESQLWSVALVDHAPAERRVVEIRRLAYRAEVLVVHDTEDPSYGYDRVAGAFSYRLDYRAHPQWTSLLSNYVDVSTWTIA